MRVHIGLSMSGKIHDACIPFESCEIKEGTSLAWMRLDADDVIDLILCIRLRCNSTAHTPEDKSVQSCSQTRVVNLYMKYPSYFNAMNYALYVCSGQDCVYTNHNPSQFILDLIAPDSRVRLVIRLYPVHHRPPAPMELPDLPLKNHSLYLPQNEMQPSVSS